MRRAERVLELQALLGDDLVVDDLRDGWPSLVSLHSGNDVMSLALFVSPVTLGHRDRDDIERRFQNPVGVALKDVPGRDSILLGVWESDDLIELERSVIALADARRREGRTTRWSAFLAVSSLVEAAETGWSSSVNDSDEDLFYFAPELLPVAVAAYLSKVKPDERQIYRALAGLGVADFDGGAPSADGERLRRTVRALVRDSQFSGKVLQAYDAMCAMCGLGLAGLVQGAHIYPASAPGSKDEVSNGLALCANHHLAFDRHLLAVHPRSGDVLISPDVMKLAASDVAVSRFLDETMPAIRTSLQGRPDASAFERRYEHYRDKYAWLPAFS